MNTVTIILNPFEPDQQRTVHRTDDVLALLAEQWEKFPEHAFIYHGPIDPANDVTPANLPGIERLASLSGEFTVVVHPGDPTTLLWIAIGLFAVTTIYFLTHLPSIPSMRNQQAGSPNNELSTRTNRARPNGRIPDIFGEQVSTPDLIALPYSIYITSGNEHREVEYAYMCVGRGTFEILEANVKDGTTRFSEIDGAGAKFFGPSTSPNSGSPQLTIGTSFTEPVFSVQRVESVNGQVLKAPNENQSTNDGIIRFQYSTSKMEANPTSTVDFTLQFVATDPVGVTVSTLNGYTAGPVIDFASLWNGLWLEWNNVTFKPGTSTVQVGNTSVPISPHFADLMVNWEMQIDCSSNPVFSGRYILTSIDTTHNVDGDLTQVVLHLQNPIRSASGWTGADVGPITASFRSNEYVTANLDGDYVATAVTAKTITFASPWLINRDWAILDLLGDPTPYCGSAVIGDTAASTNNWIGPFTLDMASMTNFIINVVAPQGMFKDDGTTQTSTSVEVVVERTPVNAQGNATGAAVTYNGTVVGSADLRSQRALTIRSGSDFTASRSKYRMRRVTPRDTLFSGQVSDEVRWKDLYGTAPVTATHFGDLTTVQSRTVATTGALAVKERKLNAKVIRKVLTFTATPDGAVTWSSGLEATQKALFILAHVCRDQFIGNRADSEINFYNLQLAAQAVETYFGHVHPAQFNYTFDKDNVSFEESVAAIAGAIYCLAYRRGNVITMDFERTNSVSKLSFNHRNKLPGSEKRSVTFGTENDVDGVELEYVHPLDQSPQTYYIPTDRSAVNPKKIQTLGVRQPLQAYFHAWRAYNKIMKQRVAVEFDCTQEAELLVRNNRILVADNTRPDTQDGEVTAKTGLVITTSQPVSFIGGGYHVFLQMTDGTVQSIVASAGATEYEITLASEPNMALSLNPSNFALATYVLVRDADARVKEFLVNDRTSSDNFTNHVTAVNYEDGYYANDTDFINNIVDEDLL